MPRLYLLELFAGKHSVSNALRRCSIGRALGDNFKLLSVDVGPKFAPTVCVDMNRWDFRRELDFFLGGRRPSDVVVVHASPPCKMYSRARTTGGPRDLRGASKNVRSALKIIGYANPTFWTLENPATGLLKDMPFMRKLERYMNTTSYCKWGFGYKKQTAIWSNIPGLQLPVCDSQTPCAIKRKHGRHLMTAQSGDSSDGTPGSGSGEAVYGLPPRLVRYLFTRGLECAASRCS